MFTLGRERYASQDVGLRKNLQKAKIMSLDNMKISIKNPGS